MFNQIFEGDSGRRAGKFLSWSLLLLAIFLGVQILQGLKRLNYIGKEIYPQRTIMVTGEGEAFAVPDIASFSFSAVEEGKTVAEAQGKAEEKINKAIAMLKENGIEEKDIKTSNYSFYPKNEWSQPPCALGYSCPPGKNNLVGYEVNQTILVKVRNTDIAGDLVTKVGSIGVSSVSGVEFTVDDREKYVAMARAEAIEKAKENAKKLADDLGVDLGKMLYFNEVGNYPMPYYAEGLGGGKDMLQAMPARSVELPMGESKITSQVNLTYELE